MNNDVIQKISNMTQPTEKRTWRIRSRLLWLTWLIPAILFVTLGSISAEQGDAEAQYNLGLMYYSGDDVPQDYEKAFELFTKSAEQGHAEAQYNLGRMYDNEEGVLQDYKQAVHWYTKSAVQGYAEAQYNLGLMYDDGEGVLQDYKQAVHWYTKSAKQSHADAQFGLGVMYAVGKGVPQDWKKTYMWLNLANHNGLSVVSIGQESRDAVAKILSSQDLIEAQEMAKRCLDSGYKNC